MVFMTREYTGDMRSSRLALVTAACFAVVIAGAERASTLAPAETLLAPAVLDALDQELSGVAAKDHVAHLAQLHRVPASPGFHEAIEYVMSRARAFGLSDVHVETFPGDGQTWFGTLHGNRGWRVEGGSLDEVSPQRRRIVSFDDVRLAVADNSESGDATAELVDVGSGARPADYQGRDVRGKLVLCDATPSACHRLAVEERGAVGLVSYNSNQPSAWWRDDQDLIRWGHLDARGRKNTFALMISFREARSLRERLGGGERITLHAVVKAHNDDQSPYETLVATIPGSDSAAGDIVFSCHLDHQKPGANDNASGCSANLEIARTLKTLIDAKRIPPPVRTIRFIWPSEMTGTIAYLTKYPEIASRIKAAVHLDMVGGDPFVTKSVLHVTRSPWSIATVTDDVEEVFGRYVIDGAFRAAGDGDMSHAIRSPGGSKDAFWADVTPYESGSDHWIYQEGGFAIPSIYLRDHPDIYIHTTKDLPDNIEPTKIKRAAFIAAASGYYLATVPDGGAALIGLSYANGQERLADDARRAFAMSRTEQSAMEAANIIGQGVRREQRRLRSIGRFVAANAPTTAHVDELVNAIGDAGKGYAKTFMPAAQIGTWASGGFKINAPTTDARVPIRSPSVKGPLDLGGDWLVEKGVTRALAIGNVPRSGDVTYEILNFIDGTRTVGDIRDAVSAEFEPVDLKAVAEYVDALASAGAVTFKR
jgi:aminopeptidase YwaD